MRLRMLMVVRWRGRFAGRSVQVTWCSLLIAIVKVMGTGGVGLWGGCGVASWVRVEVVGSKVLFIGVSGVGGWSTAM